MTPSRVRVLAAVAVVAAAGSWVLLTVWSNTGHAALPVPWTAPVGVLVLAAVVLAAAREVRRSVLGRRAGRLDPLLAARIVVLAKASSYVGAVLTGWYAAQAVVVLPALVGERRSRFTLALLTAGACLLLAAAGVVAQRWCRRPPEDPEAGAH